MKVKSIFGDQRARDPVRWRRERGNFILDRYTEDRTTKKAKFRTKSAKPAWQRDRGATRARGFADVLVADGDDLASAIDDG